jgi:rhodanese-related sulfurtransferase
MDTRTFDRRNFVVMGAVVFFAILWNATTGTRREVLDPVPQLSIAEAKAAIEAGAVVIDVRDATVAATSHVNGALIIPLEVLSTRIGTLEAYRTKPIVVYCGDGSTRGPEATALLNKAGFSQAANMTHGIQGWRAAGLPTSST